ncbi:MAG: hypothetical protein HQL82_14095 [Magnetococcales bacterium]|nr:hypothetical protein [Magnetococcales bacterium]
MLLVPTLLRGIAWGLDSHAYEQWANILIAVDFSPTAFLERVEYTRSPAPYLVWLTVLGGIKLLAGEYWARGVILYNHALAFLTILLVLDLVYRLTRNRWAVLYCALAFLTAYEYSLWIRYVLSDISFTFLTVLFFRLMVAREGSLRHRPRVLAGLAAGGALGVALFYRPTAVPMAVLWVAFLSLQKPLSLPEGALDRRRARWFLMLLTGGFVLFSLVWAYPMRDTAAWPLAGLRPWIEVIASGFQQGIVVHARPETWHPEPRTLLEFAWLAWDKALHFLFQFLARDYHPVHGVINALFFLPAFLLGGYALARALGWGPPLAPSIQWTLLWAAVFILLVTFFHALQELDYDFRYRVPLIPLLILMAGFGLHALTERTSDGGTLKAAP